RWQSNETDNGVTSAHQELVIPRFAEGVIVGTKQRKPLFLPTGSKTDWAGSGGHCKCQGKGAGRKCTHVYILLL
ncbi:MAG: hypothetical protein AAFQ09_08570, partial [Pseudomonadota bacterium]